MRPRLVPLRRAFGSSQAPLPRTFVQSTAVRYGQRTRPQLPFLSAPSASSAPQRVRYLTTERKARLKYEIKLGIKYTSYIWIAAACVAAASLAFSQEMLERQYPTPHEWTYLTRLRFRGAHCERDQTDPSRVTSWLAIMQWIKGVVERLEDPAIDGKGVRDAPPDRPPGTRDITDMPESWRRGYYEAMMLYAKAAERVDGWVRDKSRGIVFPGETMVGPSNPRPRPLPPGYKGAPREENCELAYEPADDIYLRIISTEGLTTRQRMEAGLAYASWLEFKGIAGPAGILYEDAVELALSERTSLPAEPIDRKAWTLNDAAGLPSENLLTSLTAYATFRARNGDVSSALPIFVSILKARRSLPTPDSTFASSLRPAAANSNEVDADEHITAQLAKKVARIFAPPAYPPPPADGTAPPVRDAKALCEEAALSLHIGEILYASQPASREEGLGWTREAVDVAEEQLHRLGPTAADRPARVACRECLVAGLENWSTMVARLARDEAAAAAAAEQSKKNSRLSWFGLWGVGANENLSRWEAEVKVIEERQRRAREVTEELPPPANGLAALFAA